MKFAFDNVKVWGETVGSDHKRFARLPVLGKYDTQRKYSFSPFNSA